MFFSAPIKFFQLVLSESNIIKMCYRLLLIAALIALSNSEIVIGQEELVDEISGHYTIEGKVYAPDEGPGLGQQGHAVALPSGNKWQVDLSVSINNGEYKGFVREDGQFIISGVPSGSYVLDIYHPDIFYEPVRVEINPKGKFRARKVNYMQPAQVVQVPYPLRMKPLMRFKYFQTREQWKVCAFDPIHRLSKLRPFLLSLILDYGLPLQPYGTNDGSAFVAYAGAAKDDQRPRDEEGN